MLGGARLAGAEADPITPTEAEAHLVEIWTAGVETAEIARRLPLPVHPRMLRYACGCYLANKGVDTRALQQYLGHRNIQHTVRYTELTLQRFQNFWED